MKPSKYPSTCAKMAVLGRVFTKVVLEEHGANYIERNINLVNQ